MKSCRCSQEKTRSRITIVWWRLRCGEIGIDGGGESDQGCCFLTTLPAPSTTRYVFFAALGLSTTSPLHLLFTRPVPLVFYVLP